MKYDWHLAENEAGILSWIGSPVRGNDGIVRVKVYTETNANCYYSQHAWSTLPYLKVGSLCTQGQAPQEGFNSATSPCFPIQEVTFCSSAISVTEVLATSKPQLASRLKQQECQCTCLCFESCGITYLIPYNVILCAFLGNMSPLINGVLHNGVFDEWIDSETIDENENSIEVHFSDVLSARFLSHPGTINHLIWLRYTPALYNWWKLISVNYYRGHFEVPIPDIRGAKLTFEGELYETCFFAQRMEITNARAPFRQITWTHPRIKQRDSNNSSNSTAQYIETEDPENPENDTNVFARQGVPHIDQVAPLTVLFKNPPLVRKKRVGNSESRASRQALPTEDAPAKVSTNEHSVSGALRPMSTVAETESTLNNDVSLHEEFAQLAKAIESIPGLHIVDIKYKDLNECHWLILDATFSGYKITIVEGSKDQYPCASTLIWGGDNVPLVNLLNAGSWNKKRIELSCKEKGIKSALLRHAENRTAIHWGFLLREKIFSCL